MKNIIKTSLFILAFGLSKVNAQTVYVTESGKKYHERNCKVAKTGKKGVELSEAKSKGLEPCSACFNDHKKDKPKDKKRTTKK